MDQSIAVRIHKLKNKEEIQHDYCLAFFKKDISLFLSTFALAVGTTMI